MPRPGTECSLSADVIEQEIRKEIDQPLVVPRTSCAKWWWESMVHSLERGHTDEGPETHQLVGRAWYLRRPGPLGIPKSHEAIDQRAAMPASLIRHRQSRPGPKLQAQSTWPAIGRHE